MRKKTVMAAALSLIMVLGAAGSFAPVGGVFDTAITASAQSSVSFNESTGVLTLRGNINKSEVQAYRNNKKVKSVVAEAGSVLPADCSEMFMFFKATSIDLSKADSSNVTTTKKMFNYCQDMTSFDLTGFNTSKVTDMRSMFQYAYGLTWIDLPGFNTSNCRDMGYMFDGCGALQWLNISSFDTSKVTDMSYMFGYDRNLTTIYVSNKWNAAYALDQNMFINCNKLKGGNGTGFISSKTGREYARIDKPGQPGYLTDISSKPAYSLGDVNADGNIDVEDAVMVISHVNGQRALSSDETARANVDGSSKIDIEDAVAIISHVNGVKPIS